MNSPRILLLAGRSFHSLQIAKELYKDLDAEIIGMVGSTNAPMAKSRYCDEVVVSDENHSASIKRLCRERSPEYVLPVGQRWVRALDDVRESLPTRTEFTLPSREALTVALDKKRTYEVAEEIGISTPQTAEFTTEQDVVRNFEFPVILKARKEAGVSLLKKVDSRSELQPSYDELVSEAEDNPILVQECIPGEVTYGCGVYALDGDIKLHYCQKELRSIPRMGGTGTIVELEEHTEILEKTERLLSKLNWEGIALVEFKLADGEPVLMEINPKFWASYPLASKNGYRFASQIISDTMDISIKQPARNLDATMVFPTRELYFVLKNKENESVIDSVGSMIAFGSQVDFNIEDFQAWFFPAGFANTIRWPIDLLRKKHDPIDEL